MKFICGLAVICAIALAQTSVGAQDSVSQLGAFVKDAKKLTKSTEPVVFVVGNESCDLDSSVSAVGLAYYYSKASKVPENLLIGGNRRFVPVLNIERKNLPLKSEVTYFMRENGIDLDDIVCRDEISPELLDASKFVLVDHNVPTALTSNERTFQIFDHHQFDEENARTLPADCKKRVEVVGSCASLIADEVRSVEKSFDNFVDLVSFLRGPILLDTSNLSLKGGVTKPLDIEIMDEIEAVQKLRVNNRKQLVKALGKVKKDVSTLSAEQLLYKDMKTVTNSDRTKIVAIPGFPILVEDYIQRDNVWESLQQFGKENNADVIVLMGHKKDKVAKRKRRDLGIVILRDSQLAQDLVKAITVDNAENLQLEEKTSDLIKPEQMRMFEQNNVSASRKQIFPIVQQVLSSA